MPPQLELGEVPDGLRRLFNYFVSEEIGRQTRFGVLDDPFLSNLWLRVAKDLHVLHFGYPIESFNSEVYIVKAAIKTRIDRAELGDLFDLLEFLLRHDACSNELKSKLAEALVRARAAYRVVDHQIVAIGTREQAAAFERALNDAGDNGAAGARKHLVEAGVALRNSDWAGSVRESIHAVEAIAVSLAPGTDTLGAALKLLEKRGHLHGALKSAFERLYGYTSDEEGVRHSLVLNGEAKVDEADALFMLGACASFVSYLLARSKQVA
jgi:hypothetical protein